ncbi:hypothetical protein CF326_g2508 [Tilletia indica]|nr:hypothetical protein CF326_g2508 [Tilletia indica]
MLLSFPIALCREANGCSACGNGGVTVDIGEGDQPERAELLVWEQRQQYPETYAFFGLKISGIEGSSSWCRMQSTPILKTVPPNTAAGRSNAGDANGDVGSKALDVDEKFRHLLAERSTTDVADAGTEKTIYPDVVNMSGDREVHLTFREERFKKGRPWTQATDAPQILKTIFRDANGAHLFYKLIKRHIDSTRQTERKGIDEIAPSLLRPSVLTNPEPAPVPQKPAASTVASTSKKQSSWPSGGPARDAHRELCLKRLPDADSLQWMVVEYLLENDKEEGSALWEMRDRFSAQHPRFLEAYPGSKKLYQSISNRCLALFRRGEVLRTAEGRYRALSTKLPNLGQASTCAPVSSGKLRASAAATENRSSSDSAKGPNVEDASRSVDPHSLADTSTPSRRKHQRTEEQISSKSGQVEAGSRTEGVAETSASIASRSPQHRRQCTLNKGKGRYIDSSSSSASEDDEVSMVDARRTKKIRVVGAFGGRDSDPENVGPSPAQAPLHHEDDATLARARELASVAALTTLAASKNEARQEKIKLSDGTQVSRALVHAFIRLAPNLTDVVRRAVEELAIVPSQPLLPSASTASDNQSRSSKGSTDQRERPTGVGLDVLQPCVWAHLEGGASMAGDAGKRFKVDRMTELVVLSLLENEVIDREGKGFVVRPTASPKV